MVKADSTDADNPGSIPGSGRIKMVVGHHYKTGQIFKWVYKQIKRFLKVRKCVGILDVFS